MQLLSDYRIADFARTPGSKDKKPRKFSLRKLGRATLTSEAVSGAANGAQIGGVLGLISSNPKNTFRRTLRGSAAGLAIGTGLGIRHAYKQQNK
jgi:hypothetical protein